MIKSNQVESPRQGQGILARAILESGPCAMLLLDSYAMNLPPPMDNKSDRIRISRTWLLSVLNGLGLLTAAYDGSRVFQMIELLWQDASEYGDRFHKKMNGTRLQMLRRMGWGQAMWMRLNLEF